MSFSPTVKKVTSPSSSRARSRTRLRAAFRRAHIAAELVRLLGASSASSASSFAQTAVARVPSAPWRCLVFRGGLLLFGDLALADVQDEEHRLQREQAVVRERLEFLLGP